MKLWRMYPEAPSDFHRSKTTVAQLPSPLVVAARSATGVAATTFALGFIEACLHVEHRPIPLPFATKFALYNVVPSTVWSTVRSQQIAVASNLPLERLVAPVTVHGTPNLDPRHVNRVIAIKTFRSLRYGVASYGILWCAWRWHQARVCEQPVVPEDSTQVPPPAGRVEQVLRLAPIGSFLSQATLTKHGDHVRQIPWRAVQSGDVIDWSTVGLEVNQTATNLSNTGDDGNVDGPEGHPRLLQVLELEIDSSQHDANPFLIAKRAAASANGAVHTIAVVDPAASPAWRSRSNGVDVYFFALSGIIQFLREHLEAATVGSQLALVTAMDGENDVGLEQEKVLRMVQRALIHRHGIASSIGIKHPVEDDEDEDDEDVPTLTAVFAPTVDAAVKQLARVAGFVPIDRTFVIVEESLSSKLAVPKSLIKCGGLLSVADLTDSVLQRVREQLRTGTSPEAIQLSIFEDFGEQSALLARADGHSDIAKYI